ncbi:MAG: hypothetical protein N2712_05725 [Brevinematales bacterium]|nr:hypothetical protein [Brevinematales bacterium]
MNRRYLPIWFYLGIVILLLLILGIALKVPFFLQWATPIFWTGYILLIDSIIFSFKGKSFVFFKGFPIVFIISIIVWWFFEWTNIFLSNWHYKGLPDTAIRYIGYFWAFGTILPGILITYALLLLIFKDVKIEFHSLHFKQYHLVFMIILGILFLLLPTLPLSMNYLNRSADPELFLWLRWLGDIKFSEYMAFAVWLSFFLILDPINYLMSKPSILGYIEKGNYKVIFLLSLAGLMCGFLWEFVNWFAQTRWVYNVPILGHIKIFEMPVLGYLGFITFAWELYDIASFLYKPSIIRIQEWFV